MVCMVSYYVVVGCLQRDGCYSEVDLRTSYRIYRIAYICISAHGFSKAHCNVYDRRTTTPG